MKTAMNKPVNQIHRPRPKKDRVDGKGNDKRRLWLKDGNTTMLITDQLTDGGCRALISSVNDTLTKLGVKPLAKTRFLISR